MNLSTAVPIAMAMTAAAVCRADPDPVLGVPAEAKIQAELDDITARLMGGGADPRATSAALLDACQLLNDQPSQAVQQMILWSGRADVGPRAMLPLTLISRCSVPDKAVATAIAPMLDRVYPPDQTQQAAAKKLLGDPRTNSPYELLMMLANQIEHPIETNGETVYDFSSYEPVVRRSLAGEQEAAGLFRHLFVRSPQQAIELVAKSTGDQRIIQSLDSDRRALARYIEASAAKRDDLADSLRPAAEESIESTAGDARWWVRLYAVEIANRHPELVDEQRLRLLAKDRHPAVRAAVDTKALRKSTNPTR